MKDRVPTHPGRVRLTHVSDDLYDMRMADDPTEAGTPLSKATLLKDSTAAKYGFLPTDNPTPDDIFNASFDSIPVINLDGVWTSHEIARFDAQKLNTAGSGLAGGSIGDHALFAGAGGSATVDAYDETYARTSAQPLSAARSALACAGCGTYLFFAGGITTSSSSISSVVDVYDETLTRITTLQLSAARAYLAGASVGDYAIFAGGATTESSSDVVDAYGDGLVRIVLTSLDQRRSSLTGVSAGDYAIFAGGGSSTKSAVVDAYDEAFVHTALTQLSVERTELAGAFVGGFALFGGGNQSTSSSSVASSVVDAYDTSSMTHTTATALSTARYSLASTSINGYAIFAGGQTGGSNSESDVVDAYDTTLAICSLPKLSVARRELAGATAGASAIFAGGFGAFSGKDDVDAYKIAYGLNVTIPAWSKYMIDGITSEEQFTQTDTQISGLSDNPFNGYIKRSFRLSGEI